MQTTQFVKPTARIMYPLTGEQAESDLARVEWAGRLCYKTEQKSTGAAFIRMIIRRGHLSVLEHASASFHITCDRGVSHELVRHRIASYSQESTRYVNYGQKGCAMISPASAFPDKMAEGSDLVAAWHCAVDDSVHWYNRMLELGAPPELARSVLPNATKTELVMTANLREWRHFLSLRTAPAAHPQMREIANQINEQLELTFPAVFVPEEPE